MNLLYNIKKLIEILPDKKDRNLSYGFIETRDFESLQLLIKSIWYKEKKFRKHNKLNSKIQELLELVNNYCDNLCINYEFNDEEL